MFYFNHDVEIVDRRIQRVPEFGEEPYHLLRFTVEFFGAECTLNDVFLAN